MQRVPVSLVLHPDMCMYILVPTKITAQIEKKCFLISMTLCKYTSLLYVVCEYIVSYIPGKEVLHSIQICQDLTDFLSKLCGCNPAAVRT